jgi:hypothetical protein
MQCHKCKFNGTGNEVCLKCKAAEYLDNDHKTVNPVGDINEVEDKIDPSYVDSRSKAPLLNFDEKKTKRNLEDCENVLEVLKTCHHTSFKHVACLFALFVTISANAPLLVSVLNGSSFVEYAKEHGITKQAVQQMWNRMVDKSNVLANVKERRAQIKTVAKKRDDEET